MAFKIIALFEMALFYACYFLKMIDQKRKGIQTDQMGKGKTGFVRWIEVTLKVVTCLVPAVELASIFFFESQMPLGIRIIGAVIASVGVAAFITAAATMRDSWRAGVSETDQTELVTDGIFRISRNPAFLGFDLLYIGILLMFFNWVLFAVTLFGIVMFHLQIVNVEEDFLIASFGESYLQYRKKVCRYLGRKG